MRKIDKQLNDIERRLWRLENSEKFKFNENVRLSYSGSDFMDPDVYEMDNKTVIYKGESEIKESFSGCFYRVCFIEYGNKLLKESELCLEHIKND